jgi:hypothetical protein
VAKIAKKDEPELKHTKQSSPPAKKRIRDKDLVCLDAAPRLEESVVETEPRPKKLKRKKQEELAGNSVPGAHAETTSDRIY